jgi:hypothetical protein
MKKFIGTLNKYITKPNLWWGILALLLLAPMLMFALIKNPDDQKRLRTLRQIAAETPLYPDFKQFNIAEGAKSTSANVTIWYRVPAYSTGFDQVKNFYLKELPAKGWSSPEDQRFNRVLNGEARELSFHKGEYRVSIYWEDSSPTDYGISYSWRRP